MFLHSIRRLVPLGRRSVQPRIRQSHAFQPRPLRRLVGRLERLDDRLPLAADFEHFKVLMALDVSGDGSVTPVDALQIINQLNNSGSGPVRGNRLASGEFAGRSSMAPARFDTNSDQTLSPVDALGIINRLNNHGPETMSVQGFLGDSLDALAPEQQFAIDSLFHSLNSLRVRSDILPEQVMDAVARVRDLIDQVTVPSAEQLAVVKDAFFASIEDGELSATDIDNVQEQVRQLILSLNVPQAEIDSLVADLTAMYYQIELNDADLDTLLVNVETLVNAFVPNTLDLPSVSQLRQFADEYVGQLPELLANAGNFTNLDWLANLQLPANLNLPAGFELPATLQLPGGLPLPANLGMLANLALSSNLGLLGNVQLPANLAWVANVSWLNGLLFGTPGPNPVADSGPSTDPGTDAGTDAGTGSSGDSVVDPVVEPGTDAGSGSGTDPVVDSGTDPAENPVTPPVVPPVVPPVTPPVLDPIVDLITSLGPNPLSNPAALKLVAISLLDTYSTEQLLVMLQSPVLRAQVPMLASFSPAMALSMLQNFARM